MSVGVPVEAITGGPWVKWVHVDGPYIHWAGSMEWLTWREIVCIVLHIRTIDQIGCEYWPDLARLRSAVKYAGLVRGQIVERRP